MRPEAHETERQVSIIIYGIITYFQPRIVAICLALVQIRTRSRRSGREAREKMGKDSSVWMGDKFPRDGFMIFQSTLWSTYIYFIFIVLF
jgi:hypothetical protein